MDDDIVAILTFPHNDDITSVCKGTKRILPIIFIIGQIIIALMHMISSLIYPKYIYNEKTINKDYLTVNSILVYCHLTVWIMMILIHCLVSKYHLKRLNILGYHRQHRFMRTVAKLPKIFLHYSNAIILLLIVLFGFHKNDMNHNGNQNNSNEVIIKFKIAQNELVVDLIVLLQVVICLTVIAVIICLLINLYNEIKFQRESKPPDAFCIDDPQHFENAGLNDVGLRSSTFMENLLEKQADLISNLKTQNSHLRLMLLKYSQRHEIPHNILSVNTE